MPACKESVGLSRSDGKWPDGATLIPWSHGKRLAWDVTVPNTFVSSHITSTASNVGAAADKAACSKTKQIRTSEYYSQFALETGGSWNSEAIELTNDIGKRITAINSEPLMAQFLFQRISIAVQRGNALGRPLAFRNTFPNDKNCSYPWEPLYITFNLISVFKPTGFVLVGEHNNNTFALDFRSVRFPLYLFYLVE